MDQIINFLSSPAAPTILYIVTLVIFVLSFGVSFLLKRKFAYFSKIPNPLGWTGQYTAQTIAQANGINIQVKKWTGMLTDYYNPLNKTIVLSPPVYEGRSIASVAVAAHETGHALQDAQGYFLLKFRSLIVPFINIGTSAWMWLILLGFLLQKASLLFLGIILYGLIVIFYLITLPVEIDASARAVKELQKLGFFDQFGDDKTKKQVVNFLFWAGMTYFLAFMAALAELLRLVSIFLQMQRRD